MTISSGLQTYALIKNYIGLGVSILILIGSIFFYFYISNKKYVAAKNGMLSYSRISTNDKLEKCTSELPDCNYYLEYNTNNDTYYRSAQQVDKKNKPTLGSTSVFYSEKNPSDYTLSSLNPKYISIGLMVIFIIIIIAISINIYLINKYESYGAIQGGLEAASSLNNIFNPTSYSSSFE